MNDNCVLGIDKTGDHTCSSDQTQNGIDVLINESITEAAEWREPAPRVYRKCLVPKRNKGLNLTQSQDSQKRNFQLIVRFIKMQE